MIITLWLESFASTKYQERPIVSQEVVAQRATAEQAVRDQALEINRFLAQAGRTIRPSLTVEIPVYMQTVFKWLQIKDRADDKKERHPRSC